MYVATLTLSNGVSAELTRTWLMQAQPDGERVMRRVTGYHLTAPDVSAIALVYVLDGEPLPAELTDDDISPATARAAGVLRRAWRELVARLNP